jgi:hypothetical protein
MTKDSDLSSLLERVKGADGPDREIDACITAALAEPLWPLREGASLYVDMEAYGPYVRVHDPRIGKRSKGNAPMFSLDEVPAYTSSLDAALALVERVLPGWEILITNEGDPADTWVASIGPRDTFTSFETQRPTPALALLSALLSAKLPVEDKPT